MAQVLGSVLPRLGRALGTGIAQPIEQGLDALAQKKMAQLQQQGSLDALKQAFRPEGQGLAQLASLLPPEKRGDFLKEFNIEELLASPQMQDAQQQPSGALQSLAQGQPEMEAEEKREPVQVKRREKRVEESPAKMKFYEDLRHQVGTLDDTIDTIDRMLKELEGGDVKSGIAAAKLGGVAPSWLGESSESFHKDAAHLVNLETQQLKGIPSRLRISYIAREKPGLEHSLAVNKKILQQKRKEALVKKNQIFKSYPRMEEFGMSEQGEGEDLLASIPQEILQSGKPFRNKKTGKTYQYVNGKLELYGG